MHKKRHLSEERSLNYIVKFLIKRCFRENPLVKIRTTKLIAVVFQFDVMK